MKIALTHNLRLNNSPEEAEFDSEETVQAIEAALASYGHEVERVELSTSPSRVITKLETLQPDLVFNIAEGRRGRVREALYPALFEELGLPYTGSDPYALTVSLDKSLTKKILAGVGVLSPRGRMVTHATLALGGLDELPFPVIVKPNFEGSSKGISQRSIVEDPQALNDILDELLQDYPSGVLIEQFIAGTDVTVPYLAGVPQNEGVLDPVEYVVDPAYQRRYEVYDYELKNEYSHFVDVRVPANLPHDVLHRAREITRRVVRALDVRDFGRVDLRYGKDGRLYFLEINALPSLEQGASIFAAAARVGLDYAGVVQQVVASACMRYNLPLGEQRRGPKQRKVAEKMTIGFAYNVKRIDAKQDGDDSESEYDPPKTIDAIRSAIESFGHDVVMLEATSDLPRLLADAPVDVVFNIAEGISGRNRESHVPALCELIGLPYTGSDAATLSICLDKALTKKILMQHNILTPNFQVFETGKERIQKNLHFPLICKPNEEGSSKGIGDKSVVDNEEELRSAVRGIIERYKQPAIVEEYIAGREFTVGLLGEKRPRVLPPMEIVFLDKDERRPVYDFAVKQDWKKQVSYVCPAKLTPSELRAIERVTRDTFQALDCRDVARVDLRLDAQGKLYVLEVNPLPGLTPAFSDLVMIAQAGGIDYRMLIHDILSGAMKRLKEKRRVEKESRGVGHRTEHAHSSAMHTPPAGVLAVVASAEDESLVERRQRN